MADPAGELGFVGPLGALVVLEAIGSLGALGALLSVGFCEAGVGFVVGLAEPLGSAPKLEVEPKRSKKITPMLTKSLFNLMP